MFCTVKCVILSSKCTQIHFAVGLRHDSLRGRTALSGRIARLRAVAGEKWEGTGRDSGSG